MATSDPPDPPDPPVPLHSDENLSALADSALDERIADCVGGIDSALSQRGKALNEVEKHERDAVLLAWRLGNCLLEKKRRLPHGHFTDWCLAFSARTGVSGRSASDYMRLAAHFRSAANLRPSIRESLRMVRSESREAKRDPMAPDGTTHEANLPKWGERPDISLVPPLDDIAPADAARTVRAADASLSNVHYMTADEERRRTHPTPSQANERTDRVGDSSEVPVTILDRVRAVFDGAIGCDPASNAEAQVLVQADTWYDGSEGRDGLMEPWRGPLYVNLTAEQRLTEFVSKLEREISEGRVTEWLALANLIPDKQVGQALIGMADYMCFPAGRWLPLEGTAPVDQYVIGQMLVYGGPNATRFCAVFSKIGQCAIPVKALGGAPAQGGQP